MTRTGRLEWSTGGAEDRAISPAYLFVAAILLVGLPLHTGFIHIGKALGVSSVLLRAFQPWKELLMAVVVAGFAIPLLRGELRFDWRFVVPAVAWGLFTLYLLFAASVAKFDAPAVYGFRVYAQPIAAGFAIGVILRLARREALLPYLLACVSIGIAALALLQAMFPTNAFVSSVRLATADASGQLPSAMTVSVVSQFRAFATFADPNDLGFFAAIVLIGTLAPVFDRPRERRIRLIARIGAVVVLAVSYSRSALLAVFVGLAVHGACALAFELPRFRERAVRLAIAGMGLVVGMALSYTAIADEVPQLQHLGNTVSGADPSARGHLSSLLDGFEMFKSHPEGFGLGRVGPRAELYHRGAGKQLHVESSYFQVGLEIGFSGMLIYLVAAIATFLAAIAMAGAPGNDQDAGNTRAWGRMLAALIGAQLVGYLFLPTIVSLQTGTLIWAYIGLLSGARHSARMVTGGTSPASIGPRLIAE